MRLVIFLFIFLGARPLYGQKYSQAMIDSLVHEVENKKEDTNKAELLNSISLAFADIDPEEGIRYGKSDLSLAEKLKWQTGIAAALNALGVNYTENYNYDTAIDQLSKALGLYQELNNKAGIGESYCDLGIVYFGLSDYAKALDDAFNSLKLAEELGNEYLLARNYINIGNVFRLQHNFPRSLEYHLKAKKLCAALSDISLDAKNLMDLGTAYIWHEDMKEAFKYYQEALKLYEQLGNKRGIAFAYLNIGTVYESEGDYLKGVDYVFMALSIDKALKYQLGIARDYGHLGQFYRLMGYHSELFPEHHDEYVSKAIKYTDSAITIEKKAGNMDRVAVAYRCLARALLMADSGQIAIDYYEQAISIKDSMFSADNKIQIANLEVKRESELREKQEEINKVLEIKKRNERVLFMGGIGLLAIITLAVTRNYRMQKKANDQKNVLMKEIHHRVKNNLQVISSLFSLQSETIEDETARAALAEGENRLRTIALIHQKLYEDDKPDAVNISTLAGELFIQLESAMGRRDAKVKLVKDMPDTFINNDIAVPLGLILNELITNSYKYAFLNNDEPQIKLTMRKTDDQYCLVYSDNGPGLPAGFDIAGSRSLGLKLVYGLVKQIKGRITYSGENNCTFAISFG